MSYTIKIEDTGASYGCGAQESVLDGMHRLGLRGIPVGCRGGGCGVCKVEIHDGEFRARPMSRDHVSEQEQAEGRVLACRVYPSSDLSLKVIGKLQKNVCRPAADR